MTRNFISTIILTISLFQPVYFSHAQLANTYLYDNYGNRISESSSGGQQIFYPNKYYEKTGSVNTNYIYVGNTLVATTVNNSSSTEVILNHTDQINSSTTVSNSQGNIIQNLDYYPYGEIRLNERTGTFNEHKQFGGHQIDNTGLNYFGARYHDGKTGRFLSEDPMFWKIDQDILLNPQLANSYSYAAGNPIRFTDPDGRKVNEYIKSSNAVQNIGDIMGTYKGVPLLLGAKDFEGPLNTQCPASVYRIYDHFGVDIGRGYGTAANMTQIADNYPFDLHKQGSTEIPRENDILVWNNTPDSGFTAGHVGVIAEVKYNKKTQNGTVYVVDQNRSQTDNMLKNVLTGSRQAGYTITPFDKVHSVSGWLHPQSPNLQVPKADGSFTSRVLDSIKSIFSK